jgi:2-oxoglutarate ferredoxin oxidoreductase subunit alpha
MHRIGGLEKEDLTGDVSYDPDNHHKMIDLRAKKIDGIANDIPRQEVSGPEAGDLLVLSWGGTYGACVTAAEHCRESGLSVAHAHLRYLNPFPANLGAVLANYKSILIPELNSGQLRMMIRTKYLVAPHGLNKMKGKPFTVSEIVDTIHEILS